MLELATDLFEDFSRQNALSRLELVDVQVQRSSNTFFESGINGVTTKIKKLVRGDAQSLLDSEFEIKINNNYDKF